MRNVSVSDYNQSVSAGEVLGFTCLRWLEDYGLDAEPELFPPFLDKMLTGIEVEREQRKIDRGIKEERGGLDDFRERLKDLVEDERVQDAAKQVKKVLGSLRDLWDKDKKE